MHYRERANECDARQTVTSTHFDKPKLVLNARSVGDRFRNLWVFGNFFLRFITECERLLLMEECISRISRHI